MKTMKNLSMWMLAMMMVTMMVACGSDSNDNNGNPGDPADTNLQTYLLGTWESSDAVVSIGGVDMPVAIAELGKVNIQLIFNENGKGKFGGWDNSGQWRTSDMAYQISGNTVTVKDATSELKLSYRSSDKKLSYVTEINYGGIPAKVTIFMKKL